jgi:hypothetical protein
VRSSARLDGSASIAIQGAAARLQRAVAATLAGDEAVVAVVPWMSGWRSIVRLTPSVRMRSGQFCGRLLSVWKREIGFVILILSAPPSSNIGDQAAAHRPVSSEPLP